MQLIWRWIMNRCLLPIALHTHDACASCDMALAAFAQNRCSLCRLSEAQPADVVCSHFLTFSDIHCVSLFISTFWLVTWSVGQKQKSWLPSMCPGNAKRRCPGQCRLCLNAARAGSAKGVSFWICILQRRWWPQGACQVVLYLSPIWPVKQNWQFIAHPTWEETHRVVRGFRLPSLVTGIRTVSIAPANCWSCSSSKYCSMEPVLWPAWAFSIEPLQEWRLSVLHLQIADLAADSRHVQTCINLTYFVMTCAVFTQLTSGSHSWCFHAQVTFAFSMVTTVAATANLDPEARHMICLQLVYVEPLQQMCPACMLGHGMKAFMRMLVIRHSPGDHTEWQPLNYRICWNLRLWPLTWSQRQWHAWHACFDEWWSGRKPSTGTVLTELLCRKTSWLIWTALHEDVACMRYAIYCDNCLLLCCCCMWWHALHLQQQKCSI